MNDDVVYETQTVEDGETATRPETDPTNEGFTFLDWYKDGEAFDFLTPIKEDITLTAEWQDPDKEYVTVTFKKDDGSVPATKKIEKGQKVSKPTDPVKAGHTFVGWYTESETEFDFNTPINEDITLTAKWSVASVPVQSIMITGAESVAKGGSVKLSATVTPGNATNRAIVWSVKQETEGVTVASNGNVTVSADCAANSVIIRAVSAADESVSDEHTLRIIDVSAINAGITITKEEGWLESSYIEWSEATSDEIDGYNVYVREAGGEYVKLDDMLVRAYSNTAGGTAIDYYRADALGLKAGTYQMKVVGTASGIEAEKVYAESKAITVEAHTREGYAFEKAETGKSASGAYNDDGTLRANARVIYVTDDNKDTVTLNVKYDKTYQDFVGVQNIIGAYKKKSDDRPLAIRFIGNINDPANMPKGDLYVDGVVNGMTIEGVGNDATCNGFGIVIKSSSYVEVRNLGFMNCNSDEGDDVGLQQDNDHIWVHNCDMFYGHAGSDGDQKKGDGALDTKKSTYITHSFNHFWDNGKCNLQGAKVSDENTSNYITYHHNWYDHSDSRHPRIRVATVHVYNNYYDGNAKYGIGATSGASVFADSNYFRSTANMRPMMIAMQGTDSVTADNPSKGTFTSEDGGIIKAYGNEFNCTAENRFLAYDATPTLKLHQGLNSKVDFDAYVVTDRNGKVPDTVVTKQGGHTYNNFDTDPNFYSYSPDTAEQAKTKVMNYAGRIDGGDFKYTFDNAKEDGNSEVIDELKTRLTNYKSCLVKAMGSSSAGGGDGAGDDPSSGGGDTGSSGNDSGAVSGNLSATFTATANISANDILLKVTDGGAEIASVKSLVAFSKKTSGAGGVQSSSSGAFEITLKAGYTYTVSINLGSSGGSTRTITINGEQKNTGTDAAFVVCTWTVPATNDLVLTSQESGNIRFDNFTITAVKS